MASDGGGYRVWAAPAGAYLVLYLPVYWRHAGSIWNQPEYAYAPLVGLLCLWLLWRERNALRHAAPGDGDHTGPFLLALGLALYSLSVTRQAAFLEALSQVPVLAGLVLSLAGRRALGRVAFPVLFLAFMAPVPDTLLRTVTGHLKEWVSIASADWLYLAGYPVARSGNLLMVGPYQLLVDDVCSGLNSMVALTALGLLYQHLAGDTGSWRRWILLLAIPVIALVSNVVRVVLVGIATYTWGSSVAEGLAHNFSGAILFLSALLLLLATDATLRAVGKNRRTAPAS